MEKSIVVNSLIQKNILSGAKIPHSTSYPVIYKESNKYYLAVFVFFFSKEDIQEGKINRPSVWALVDIKTGEIIEERQTKDIDFSDASYDIKYDVKTDAQYDTSKKYYDRSKIINDGKFYKEEYQYYLNKIVANIPKEYQRFYYDLSV